MKKSHKGTLALCSIATWIAGAMIYNEFGYDKNPDGMMRDMTGLMLVGPAIAAVQAWLFVHVYRRLDNEKRKDQLVAGLILCPIVFFVVEGLSTS